MGNVKGIRKYSVLERRPQNGALVERLCVVVSRGLYALYLKPHQSPVPCVM